MNDLEVLSSHYLEVLNKKYSYLYNVTMRPIGTSELSSNRIELDPTIWDDIYRRSRIYLINFGMDFIWISYLKSSIWSMHEEVARLSYANPKTGPKRVIRILDKNMKEEDQKIKDAADERERVERIIKDESDGNH